ncbi:MAG TPA: Hsp70 family protein [Myxococcus sp.]|nr:Hsp70 family protein [Myxococcus sp.]
MNRKHRGAVLGEGLFCSHCGTARHFEGGARLVEALSIEVADGVAHPLIPYGARLPTTYSGSFSTAADSQPTFQVHLLVGNSPRASENRTLLRLVLPLERPGPRTGPVTQLTMTIDATGALPLEAHARGAAKSFRREDFRIGVVARP